MAYLIHFLLWDMNGQILSCSGPVVALPFASQRIHSMANGVTPSFRRHMVLHIPYFQGPAVTLVEPQPYNQTVCILESNAPRTQPHSA
eukprot:3123446-Pyramimonas_sp.AAC.1